MQHRKSLRTADIAEARLRLAQFRLELAGKKVLPPTTPPPEVPSPIVLSPVTAPSPPPQNHPLAGMTFEQVGTKWMETLVDITSSTRKRRRYSIQVVGKALGKKKLVTQISFLDCERFAARHSAKLAARTYNQDINTLKAVFRYAELHKLIPESPAEHLKRKIVRPKPRIVPSQKEFAEILRVMRSRKASGSPGAHDAANMAELISLTGMRRGEAQALRWGDVDFEKKLLHVRGTKTANAIREVPLFAATEQLLRRMFSDQHPRRDISTARKSGRVLLVDECKVPMAYACKVLGLPKLNDCYSLRHYAATQWLEAGCNFKTIGQWLGHSALDGGALAAKTYTHFRPDFSVEEIKRVNASVG